MSLRCATRRPIYRGLTRMTADKRNTYHGGTETLRKPEMSVEFIKGLDPTLSAAILTDPRLSSRSRVRQGSQSFFFSAVLRASAVQFLCFSPRLRVSVVRFCFFTRVIQRRSRLRHPHSVAARRRWRREDVFAGIGATLYGGCPCRCRGRYARA
jgi:hypothetical protein